MENRKLDIRNQKPENVKYLIGNWKSDTRTQEMEHKKLETRNWKMKN